MAVYTHVDDEELAEFLAAYDLGTVLSFKGIAEGVENSNYLLRTEAGSFILTLYEKRVHEEDLPFFLGLMRHLAGQGVPCPTPVEAADGSALHELCDRPAALISYLDGVSLRHPRPNHCAELGRALANLHIAGGGFELERENALGPKGWVPLAEASKDQADSVKDGLKSLIETEMEEVARDWPTELPRGVIHADLFPDNVFFLGDELSGLIDFYFACNDLLAYDLAICLIAWCFEDDRSFNTTKARALVRGYNSIRPLSREEEQALPLLSRGAALRFLLTRLYDWVNQVEGAVVRPKNPMEFVQRLQFLQRIRGPGEFGLG